MMIAATRDGSTDDLNSDSIAARLFPVLPPRYASGNGTWKVSAGNGPKPALYGLILPVSASAISVRP